MLGTRYTGRHRTPEVEDTSGRKVAGKLVRRIGVPSFIVLASLFGFSSIASAAPVQVRSGDTFSALVSRHCGTNNWQAVAFPGRNKNLIYAGETIDITCPGAAAPAQQPAQQSSSGWTHPLPGRCVSSGFGWRSSTNSNHRGVDLPAPVGTDVRAAAAGTAHWGSEGGPNGLRGAGWYLTISHGNGWATTYFHLSRRLVNDGAWVNAGQHIAESGGARGAYGSGNSHGPHLHFETHTGGLWNNRVNPFTFMSARGVGLWWC